MPNHRLRTGVVGAAIQLYSSVRHGGPGTIARVGVPLVTELRQGIRADASPAEAVVLRVLALIGAHRSTSWRRFANCL